jgi:cholesterol transport system auxiliary component
MMRCLSWILMLLLAVPACSVLPERAPQPALHDFGAAVAAAPAPWSSIEVDAPDWLQTDRLQYRLLYANPTELRAYALDRWIAPPPALLEQRLKAERNGSGYRLRIELQAFEQVFDRSGSSHVTIRFRAETPTADKTFQLDQPTASPDAAGAVTAFAQLVERTVAVLRAWQPAR